MLSVEGPTTIRVLVIDERTVVREGLRLILSADPVFEVIAMVGRLGPGIAVARDRRPHVVLVGMPRGMAGRELVRSLRGELPDASLVVLTDLAEDDAVAGALREGAVAYVVKDASADEVRSTIRSAVPGWRGRPSAMPPMPDHAQSDTRTLLSRREREVLALIAEGKPNRAIAVEMGVSSETVKTYVKRIMGKLRVDSRTEAAVVALTTGMARSALPDHARGGRRSSQGGPRP